MSYPKDPITSASIRKFLLTDDTISLTAALDSSAATEDISLAISTLESRISKLESENASLHSLVAELYDKVIELSVTVSSNTLVIVPPDED